MTGLDTILTAADAARRPAANATSAARAQWLRAIADGLEADGDRLIGIAGRETNLPETRLRGELTRTVFQARLFADRVAAGDLLDSRIDPADPDWPMGPRPDIRRSHVPIGPVLVYAASNFPFAFSVAGGDTVSALAVGCPVVVKTHEGHAELSLATAEVVQNALSSVGAPHGLFAVISSRQDGVAAIQDPRIKAAGFTGSLAGGRALFDLATSRPDPIPFYGELGSTNPVMVTTAGWQQRGAEIAAGFTNSFTLGAGQFCTQPGVVLVPDLDGFVDSCELPTVHPMLNGRIREGFEDAVAGLSGHPDVRVLARVPGSDAAPGPTLLGTTADAVLADPAIVTTEMFGPASVLVSYTDIGQALAVVASVGGALTATIQGTTELDPDAQPLLEVMAGIAGRVIYNEWPTGVTVSDAQQHGGPWPATTASISTSVGTAAAQRFARPVAYQNVPAAGLPEELRE
ncbi:aldehyde dehydrogenase (NADP(+)) [Mycobacterium sp. AMU20-3851]|uniref:aldehyde dehydrogenase (NADP(+)) n=1 Tax=Mycobacterium sp. AMU20-3851 TaxID=3122055 RepID=UPI00375502F7